MWSNLQVFLLMLSISFCTASHESGENVLSGFACSLVAGLNSSIPVNLLHMFLIFSRKNVAHSLVNMLSV